MSANATSRYSTGALLAWCVLSWSAPTLATAPIGQPAAWRPHDVIVSLHDLPQAYSCDDLWYKFRDVLLALGARADVKILVYQCGPTAGVLGRSPDVHLQFAAPELLDRDQSKWAQFTAAATSIELAPGQPASLHASDCELLRQIKDELLPELGETVVRADLACAAAKSVHGHFSLTVRTLTPVDSNKHVVAIAPYPAPHQSLQGHLMTEDGVTECQYGYLRIGMTCRKVEVPENAHLTNDGDSWECDRGYHTSATGCARIELPANAHLTDISAGTGWECNVGYRVQANTCQPIHIPDHGYPVFAPWGSGWNCNRGYARTGETCTVVKVPSHGYLTAAGDDWQCDRGYVRRNGTCAQLRVPANAHIDASGSDWECDRGFRKGPTSCSAIEVPPHAYAMYETTDRDWQCERGYRVDGARCVTVVVPQHAFLDESGHSWKCDRGFSVSQQHRCAKLQVPTHAHLDLTGNAWTCNFGFESNGQQCVASSHGIGDDLSS